MENLGVNRIWSHVDHALIHGVRTRMVHNLKQQNKHKKVTSDHLAQKNSILDCLVEMVILH